MSGNEPREPDKVDEKGENHLNDDSQGASRPAIHHKKKTIHFDGDLLGLKNQLNIAAPYLCSFWATATIVQGGIIGAIGGAGYGLLEARLQKLNGPILKQFLFASSKKCAFFLSGWWGCYQGSKCVLLMTREKHDMYNSFFGGFIAGAAFSLRTRSIPKVIMLGLASGSFMSGVENVFPPTFGRTSIPFER